VYNNPEHKRNWSESNKSIQAVAKSGLHPEKILFSPFGGIA